MKEYVRKIVTYTVKPYINTDTRNNAVDIATFLTGTGIKVVGWSRTAVSLEYPKPSPIHAEAPLRDLHNGDVVVLSSLGEVTVMTGERFKKEFEEK